jgi:hypothetical protein
MIEGQFTLPIQLNFLTNTSFKKLPLYESKMLIRKLVRSCYFIKSKRNVLVVEHVKLTRGKKSIYLNEIVVAKRSGCTTISAFS